ncbi:hypothetical protein [Bradyrhizobium liaoningense]|uniref:hypothetical protein n=1 Tax=Bradyrhizobium liaoningense TaxID=43992 RepID=UPI001BA5F067|nr:hypothetical protein [Bradyrhizobium liaoningense]MBR1167522.1 hypothetical protein [Bradyrhizobium liaoningense]
MDRKTREAQALRLVTAYLKIDDPNTRETIVALAEAAADGATFEVKHRLVEQASQKPLN